MPSVSCSVSLGSVATMGGGAAAIPQEANLIRHWVASADDITEAADVVSSWLDRVASKDLSNAATTGPDFIPGDPSVQFVASNSEALQEGSADAAAQITAAGITVWGLLDAVTSSGANQNTFAKWSATKREYVVQAHNTIPSAPRVVLRNAADTTAQVIDGAVSILGGGKSLIVFTLVGASGSATGKLFVNSAAAVSQGSLSWRTDTAVLSVGALESDAANTLNGKVLRWGIYNVGLTDDEVGDLKTFVNENHGTSFT